MSAVPAHMEEDPTVPDVPLREYLAKIEEWIRSGEPGKAIAHGRHVVSLYPECASAHRVLGEAYLEKGMLAEAQGSFERTLAADPESAIAHIGLSLVYDRKGMLAEAIGQMERAFDVAAGNREVRADLQTLYRRRGDSRTSGPALTRGAMARVYAQNGLLERAISEYQEAVHQNPELADARAGLAEVLWRAGRKEEALETCRRLLEKAPHCLKALLILGQVLLEEGQDDAAEAALTQALAIDPENRMASAVLGELSPLPLREVQIAELGSAEEPVPDASEEDRMEEKDTGADETASGRPAEPAPKESVLAEPPGSGAGQPTGSSAQGEELPDWLRDSPPGETLPPTASGSEETAGEGSRPEWLEAWDAGRTAEADVPQSEEAPAGQPEPPEWLGTLAEQAAGSEEPGLPEAAAAAEPVLDVAAELLAEEAEPQETGPAAVIPDWVRRMEEAVTDETLPAGAEALGAAGPAAAAKENPQHAGSPAQRQRIGELTHLVHQEPGKYWARIELARLCSLTGDWDGALLQYEELIAGHKMIRAVILDLQALLEQEVDRVQVYRLLGDAYMESDQIDQALDMYRLARQILRKR